MVKNFLYAFLAVALVYVISMVAGWLVEAMNSAAMGIVIIVLVALVAGYISYRAKIMLNVKEGKKASSGLFFGLLTYIFFVLLTSIDNSVNGGVLNVTFITTQSVGLLVGALIAGKKTA